MSVTTSIETVTVVTTLGDNGVSTVAEEPTVEVTIEGGDVVVAEMQGISGVRGASILSGTTLPDDSAGSLGDYYLRTTTSILYGPKAGGTWAGVPSLNLTGSQGPTGPKGDKGDQGIQGPAGASDWSAVANKPTFATVATSGAYSDLSGKPTLGTAAAKNTGTSGNTVPLLDGVNTWSGGQTLSGNLTLSGTAKLYPNAFDSISSPGAGTTEFSSPYANNVNVKSGQSGQSAALSLITAEGKIASFTHYDTANATYGRLLSIASQPGVPISFSPSGLGAVLTMATTGKVGIGTASPTDTLTVAGTISATNLGTASAKNTGTSGNTVPLLDGANTWSANQTFSGSSGVNVNLNAGGKLGLLQLDAVGNLILRNSSSGGWYLDTYSGNITIRNGSNSYATIATFAAGALVLPGALTASNVSGTNTGDQTITLTGDVTGSGTSSLAATLATVNANIGSFGSASAVPIITVNGKGLVTAVSTAPLGTAAAKNTGTSGNAVPLLDGVNTWSGKNTTAASTTATAGLNIPHGSAPTTPTNGDVWTTSSGLYARISGTTVGPFGAGGLASAGTTQSNIAARGVTVNRPLRAGQVGLFRWEEASNWELRWGFWTGSAVTQPTNGFVSSSTGSPISFTSAATVTLVDDIGLFSKARNEPVAWLSPSFGSSTPASSGLAIGSTLGTQTSVTWADTNVFAREPRIQQTSTTGANADVGRYGTFYIASRNSGFHYSQRFGFSQLPTGPRFCAGMSAYLLNLNIEPSAITDMAMFGFDSTDTTFQFMTNDTTGSAAKVNTGISYAINTLYEASVWCDPGGNCYGLLIDYSNQALWYGVATSDLPVAADGLTYRISGALSSTTGTAIIVHTGQLAIRTGA